MQKQQEIRKIHYSERNENPTHTTICNWVLKVGYHELTRSLPEGDDWVIILDTSIQMGQDKVLNILAVQQSLIDFSRPLREQDLTPVSIEVGNNWTGKTVSEALIELKSRIGKIIYAVGDHGGEIKKGLELAGIVHVHDVTHVLALLVEKRYKENPRYKELCTQMSVMRVKLSQSVVAEIIPPSQRKKSAYQNLRPITEWGQKCLAKLQDHEINLPQNQRIKEELCWLAHHKALIEELDQITTAINRMEKKLKHNGLSKDSLRYCNAVLNQLNIPDAGDFKVKFLAKLKEAMANLPNQTKILCTSDILESIFGHYKNFTSQCPMAGVTQLVLVMAAFTAEITPEYVKYCLENVTMKQLNTWKKQNIKESLFQKRIAFFKSAG